MRKTNEVLWIFLQDTKVKKVLTVGFQYRMATCSYERHKQQKALRFRLNWGGVDNTEVTAGWWLGRGEKTESGGWYRKGKTFSDSRSCLKRISLCLKIIHPDFFSEWLWSTTHGDIDMGGRNWGTCRCFLSNFPLCFPACRPNTWWALLSGRQQTWCYKLHSDREISVPINHQCIHFCPVQVCVGILCRKRMMKVVVVVGGSVSGRFPVKTDLSDSNLSAFIPFDIASA